MTLYEGKTGCAYKVRELSMEEGLMRRLQALGLNEGTGVRVLNRKRKGALILYVRGTRLAVGKHISAHIEVDPEEDER
ncbi:MAG TPA: FeoA domain-containing protein [Candidatus Eisenbergiella merdigallinarum]|uniref:FeoA domain-containing protein n=1 Tax=Candidatus Eisenbergiella merdigallinarum TaxID=2838552 RepID=A0A9D2MR10_9FIRM|nr:FeoA domain-containing protein [Candidatus Eisenbergiella merdigallinarum]